MIKSRFVASAVLAVAACGSAWGLKFNATFDPIKVYAEPGQVVNRVFKLLLAQDEQRTQFKVHTEDWWRTEDGKRTFYRAPGSTEAPSRSCAGWVRLNPVESAIEPGGSLNVRISIKIPDDVKPGGYWCMLTVDQVPDPLAAQGSGVGVHFNTSVSVAIYVYVSPLVRQTRITDVQILPNRASLKIVNEGNCPLSIEGRFEFTKPSETKPVATIKMPHEVCLPEPISSLVIGVDLPDANALPSGRYVVSAILDIGLDHLIGVRKEVDFSRDTPMVAQTR